jgi:hypothetical protein
MDDEGAGLVEDAASEERIANLEGELKEAADQEAETAQRFDKERWRRAALDQQLHEAREETARLMLHEASQTGSAMRAEAVELLQASRVQAEREAGQVSKRAFEQANEMIAIARREAVAIVDAGRDEVRALEDDAARQTADLDTEHRKLTHRLGVMETLCDELVATLNLVAEIAVKELVETQDSLKQLDLRDTEEPPAEPNSEPSTPSSAPQGELLGSGQPKANRSVHQARAEASRERDQLERPPQFVVPESDDDRREELAAIVDDRDLEQRRSRQRRWLTFNRKDRDSRQNRARQAEAISERLGQVLSSGNAVESADPEEVDARLRNLSHGTNGK